MLETESIRQVHGTSPFSNKRNPSKSVPDGDSAITARSTLLFYRSRLVLQATTQKLVLSIDSKMVGIQSSPEKIHPIQGAVISCGRQRNRCLLPETLTEPWVKFLQRCGLSIRREKNPEAIGDRRRSQVT
jgi:hypothetical protein